MSVVGRLAPSPTGRLHLGHARSFLLAWWSARGAGGSVVLRIDDLDGQRTVPGAADALMDDLRWLGLDWDGAPLRQSTRHEAYADALDRLRDDDLVYPCVCTRREILEAASAPHGDAGEARYPGTCLASPTRAARAAPGEAAWRLRTRPGTVRWRDRVAGPRSVDVHATTGDFVVCRKDGTASYQLATVVDDAEQGVTEVVRGDDLLTSAARQRMLQGALGLEAPTQAHVPLVLDHGGARLAKRDAALSLAELRRGGMDPRRICRWAARSAGFTETDHPQPANFWVERAMIPNMAREPVRLPERPAEDL